MNQLTDQQAAWFAEAIGKLSTNVQSVVRGKDSQVRLALVCLLAEGHLLIEDVPGTGKTTLAKAMAESIAGSWKRVQFTPDLLPSDVTGAQIFNQVTGSFEFHPGAVFANIVLADEINRASPKTQSALLEVMEERQHTVDGERYGLPRPFVVVATQNPVEQDGTYRLPEAQLDRFLMKISLGYPDHTSELEVLAATNNAVAPVDALTPVMSASDVADLITMASGVYAAEPVQSYIIHLAEATRRRPEFKLGVSTRGCIGLLKAARAYAASFGRPYVTPDDVKVLTSSVFTHRIILSNEAELQQISTAQVLDRILEETPPPVLRAE